MRQVSTTVVLPLQRTWSPLLALNAGDYFFDIGVSIKPDGNLAKHLNGESKFSGGAVGNGSYLMGGHDKEAIEMVVEFLYGLYTCERAPTVHPKKQWRS